MAHQPVRTRRPGFARAAWVAIVCLAGCGPSEDQAASLGNYLLQSLVFARQTADTMMIAEIFQPDATYDDYPDQVQYQGLGEIIGYLTSVHDWADDVYLNLGSVQTGPTGATGEWLLAAVQARPVPEVITTATGKEVVISGVTVLEIEGGRIARAADYWDRSTFMLQLGGRIQLPDGTILDDGSGGV